LKTIKNERRSPTRKQHKPRVFQESNQAATRIDALQSSSDCRLPIADRQLPMIDS
jgi:hypothetical protein